jgi:hypothetical protein
VPHLNAQQQQQQQQPQHATLASIHADYTHIPPYVLYSYKALKKRQAIPRV